MNIDFSKLLKSIPVYFVAVIIMCVAVLINYI